MLELVSILLLGSILIIVCRAYYLTKIIKGEVINHEINDNTAFLILDMQNDTWNNPAYKDKSKKLEKINSIIQSNKMNNNIVYIKNIFHNNIIDKALSLNKYQKETCGAEYVVDLDILENSRHFIKSRNDTFSQKEFTEYLEECHIGKLYIVGADGGACVYKTAISAKKRGYDVYIVEDAVYYLTEKHKQVIENKYINLGINVIKSAELT